jgi:hypothetical protein
MTIGSGVTLPVNDGDEVLEPYSRRKPEEKAAVIVAALRAQQLGQPPAVAAAYAATVRSLVRMITAFNAGIAVMEEQVTACFGQARDAKMHQSQGTVTRWDPAQALFSNRHASRDTSELLVCVADMSVTLTGRGLKGLVEPTGLRSPMCLVSAT